MTRLWQQGQEIKVITDSEGVPISFQWNGRVHHILLISKHWRVHDGWWRREVWRHYFKLVTDSGLLCVIYHDLLKGSWYLQRIYD